MSTKVQDNTRTATGGGPEISATVDGAAARRKASAHLAAHIGDAMMGVNPVLVVGDPAVWRDSVVLASPDVGTIGEVGTIDVDATSGAVCITEAQADSLTKAAHSLAQRSSAVARR